MIHFSASDTAYLPTSLLVNGFFTIDGQKISKSLGNTIEPKEYCEQYSKDLLILYMLSAFPLGNDGDYDRKDAILTFNAKLANNLGNLLNRAVVLTNKLENLDGAALNDEIAQKLEVYNKNYKKAFDAFELKHVLDLTFKFLDDVNLYITETAPWTLMKDESTLEEAKNILYTVSESLRQVGINLYPFFSEKMLEMFTMLGFSDYETRLKNGESENMRDERPVFTMAEKSTILFQKFDV